MPGIVGIISRRPADDCESLVEAMVASMKHEHFYTCGTHFAPEVGIHCGWTALDGSFAANQVLFNERKDVALVCAGEIFPNSDRRGQNNTSESSNREWLFDLYEKEGDHFFEKLNGLFSGLLVDRKHGKAFLFNDRYGSERIYWHKSADAFYFASEAKALLRVLPHLREFDPEGVAQFCAFGSTFNCQTLFRDIHLLPGGSVFTFAGDTCDQRQYFDRQTWESLPPLSVESFESRFEEVFKQILPRYFTTEQEIGISLTGGLDTRMVMACRPQTNESPLCYTFTGRTGETLDDRIARQVAGLCGLEHRLLRLHDDFFSDFADHADRTVYITDGCFGITGAHEVYFNRQARQLAPVRVTGLFGSEILRGASGFKPVPLSDSLFDRDFAQVVGAISRSQGNSTNPVSAAAFRNVPWNLFGSTAASRSQVVLRTPYLDNEIVALAFQAPDHLRTSARPALSLIEHNNRALANVPTDRRVEKKNARLLGKLERLFFEASFKLDYLHNEGMPDWLCPFDRVFDRIDSGLRIFGHHKYLHYRSWFRGELASYVTDALTDSGVAAAPFWNRAFLPKMIEAHISGRKNYMLEIHTVLTLAAIDRLLFRGLPRTIDSRRSIYAML